LRCFRKHDSKIKKIKLIKGISSTRIRDIIIKDKAWQKLVPKEIVAYLEKIECAKRVKRIYARK